MDMLDALDRWNVAPPPHRTLIVDVNSTLFEIIGELYSHPYPWIFFAFLPLVYPNDHGFVCPYDHGFEEMCHRGITVRIVGGSV